MRSKKLIILVVTIFILLILGYGAYTGYFVLSDSRESAKVSDVIDGDTIVLSDGRKVRLLGINTPERNEYFYNEAKEYLGKLIENKQVALEAFGKDKYDRILGYVYLDKVLVNFELVKNGFAHVYLLSPDEKFYLEFKKAEKEAKDKKVGIWKSSSNDCVSLINFHYNAEGNDNANLNDEYVVFRNKCDNAISLSGWMIKDEGTNIYKFKTFVFYPSSEFTLYSGSGNDSNNGLYWNSNRAIWNNDKDTLFLKDSNGNLVLEYTYPS